MNNKYHTKNVKILKICKKVCLLPLFYIIVRKKVMSLQGNRIKISKKSERIYTWITPNKHSAIRGKAWQHPLPELRSSSTIYPKPFLIHINTIFLEKSPDFILNHFFFMVFLYLISQTELPQ